MSAVAGPKISAVELGSRASALGALNVGGDVCLGVLTLSYESSESSAPFECANGLEAAVGVTARGVSAGLSLLAGGATIVDDVIESARSRGARKGRAADVTWAAFGTDGGSVTSGISEESV